MARTSIGMAWLTVIVVIFQVMLVWGILHDVVTGVLYDLGVACGCDVGLLDFIVAVWTNFPIPFIFGVIVWAIVVSLRAQEDAYI
jgi:hypothetical protein